MMNLDEDPKATTYLSDFCKEHYGIIGELTTVVNGLNWTLAVEARDGMKYFGRVYRVSGRSKADVLAEHSILGAIVETSFLRVIRPLRSRDGNTALELDFGMGGRRLFALYPCAPGRPMEYTAHDFRVAGRALAELHRQAHLTSRSPGRQLYDPNELTAALAQIAGHSADGREVSFELSACLDELLRAGADHVILGRGLCHGDFRVSNVHIDQECAHIFDWDDCGVGPYWGDLAKMGTWLDILNPPGVLDIWKNFTGSYGLCSEDRTARLATRWLIATGTVINAASVLKPEFDLSAETLQVLFARTIEATKRARDDTLRIG
ncbi:phosphotransferase enzyme family protein [Bradyrhizobium sp. CCBAU 45384]|uniref:phosphotransferase enzyme family protein n=1 Tax=Bradyrhizobium sp. CCBAU 45384 TaxID=858428 RepID=UPI002305AA77|nr:phosphotransferase [Bradyrhizobium sp. CCBAU 45384]MDA9406337.1 hypothetical protein [Bradyrhizobium sp. CCBAU 45384]